jgi:hypothetical protein
MGEAEAGKVIDCGFASFGVEDPQDGMDEIGETGGEPAAAGGPDKLNLPPLFTAVFYSHNRGPKAVLDLCWRALRLEVAQAGGELVAVTWEPMDALEGEYPPFTQIIQETPHAMHRCIYDQILKGIAAAKAPVVFLCEHDVLYDAEYFDEMLGHLDPHNAATYYNKNVWHLDPRGFFQANTRDFHFLSNCMALKDVMKSAIEAKVKECEQNGSPVHAEPLGDTAPVVDVICDTPTVDIRHGRNFTGMREPEDGPIQDHLEPFGLFEDYKFIFSDYQGPKLQAVAGMTAKAVDISRFKIRLASCCEEARRSPKDRLFCFTTVNGQWLQTWWVQTSNDGKKIGWFAGVFPAHNCMDCGKPLTDKTPSRVYEPGYWRPLDGIIDAHLAKVAK